MQITSPLRQKGRGTRKPLDESDPFPSPDEPPNLGTEPTSPTLAGGFFNTEPPEKP